MAPTAKNRSDGVVEWKYLLFFVLLVKCCIADAAETNGSTPATLVSAKEPSASLVEHTDAILKLVPPRNLDPSILKSRAIPTNNWWGNLIAHDTGAKLQPIWSNPYAISVVIDVAPYGIDVSYPYKSRVSGGSTGNDKAIRFYAHGINKEFMFSATEFTSKPVFQVSDWGDLGVKVQMEISSTKAMMEAQLVSGMAYASVKYQALSPKIVSSSVIQTVNGSPVSPGNIVAGTKLVITLNNGEKWVLYALNGDGTSDQTLNFTLESSFALVCNTPFNGILRAALVVQDTDESSLDKHKNCIAKDAKLVILDDSSYSFNWQLAGNCANGLLHYAVQHLHDSMDRSSAYEIAGMTSQSTTRGTLQAYVTKTTPATWKFVEKQVIPVDFYPARPVTPQDVQNQQLLDLLKQDIHQNWSMPLDGSFYFNGKAAQKYASLCLMANDENVVGRDKMLLGRCLAKLRQVLEPFVANRWANKLQYDVIYRGVLSSEGFKKNDPNADFGNSMYNDHHFHYGYWLTASAIVNLLDPNWSELGRLNEMAILLMRDVANFNDDDVFFPKFRSFDWFRGHSYSHGVTPFADGKDEESTSEDINFAYGMMLFGKATGNDKVLQVGKLMTRVNAHAIKTYFLMEADNVVHPENFKANKVTGIFFDNKVDYATWFSAEKHCIHGIQMIPISPITEIVRTLEFVRQEWTQVLSKEPIVAKEDLSNAWLSLLYANYATVDKRKAMQVLQKAKMDDGLSRSWAIYIAATRPTPTASG